MPITSFPVEILIDVFEYYVKGDSEGPGSGEMGCSPHVLTLICRQWYQVAMDTASLWTKILVADTRQSYWKLARNSRLGVRSTSTVACYSHSAMQICNTVDHLVTILRRTGTAPLDITLGYIPKGIFEDERYLALFSAQIRPRITHLTLDYSGSWNGIDSFSNFTLSYPLELRNLVSLRVFERSTFMPYSTTPIVQVILEGTNKLRELCVGVNVISIRDPAAWQGMVGGSAFPDCIKQSVWKHSSYSLTMRNLENLQVASGEAVNIIYGKYVPLLEFITQSASQIERADSTKMWEISTLPWPTSTSPMTTFTCIKRLHLILNDISLLTRLDIPVLEELCVTQSSRSRNQAIHGYTEPPVAPNVIIHFPKLYTLKVTHSHLSPLRWISAEQLDSMFLTSTVLSRKKAEMEFTLLFSSIKSVKLQDVSPGRMPSTLLYISRLYVNANISERVMTQALESLPRLEFLSLVPGEQLKRDFIKALTVSGEYNVVKRNILCPVLQVLELDLHNFLGWDETGDTGARVGTVTSEELPLAMERMVSSREQGYTYPLEWCTVVEREGTRREYV